MKITSQRLIFTALMTCLATVFGALYAIYELRSHPDMVSDVVKISALLAIASACVSYVFWTMTHIRKDSVFRGGLAGFLTGAAIVQIPYFASTFKAEFFRFYNVEGANVLMSVFAAMPLSLKTGLETFQVISKVSLMAVLSSMILGIIIAKKVPSPRRG